MAKEISRKLRDLADKIDTLDDAEADSLIKEDEELATKFFEILKIVPKSWKRHSKRLYTQLERNNKCIELRGDQKDTIWGWRLSQQAFCRPISDDTSSNQSASFPLDPLVETIAKTNDTIVTLSIHWRLSLLTISEVRVHVCPNITDHAEVAQFFRRSGLISDSGYEIFSKHSEDWIRGGDSYRAIAQDLGGRGCVMYLPLIGRTNYERYYTLKGPNSSVLKLLATVNDHARSTWKDLTAHDVVDQIVDNAKERTKDLRIPVHVSFTSSNTEKTKPKRTRRRGRTTRSDDTSARSKRHCTNRPRTTSDQPQDETLLDGFEFSRPAQDLNVNELSTEEAASLLSTRRDGQQTTSRAHVSHEATSIRGAIDTSIHYTRNAQRSSSESSTGGANQDTQRTDRLDVCPMVKQIHSSSATSQIQNARETQESTLPSASLSANLTGLDSARFVYQNDSLVVNDESNSVQETHATNCYHDENIITMEEESSDRQNQAYASNSLGIFPANSRSFNTKQAINVETNPTWQTNTTGVPFNMSQAIDDEASLYWQTNTTGVPFNMGQAIDDEASLYWQTNSTGVPFNMSQAIDDEANFHWQTDTNSVSFNMYEAINSSYSIHHEAAEQGTLPLSGTATRTLEDLIAEANARIDTFHSMT